MSEEITITSGILECIGRCNKVSYFYFEAKRVAQPPEEWLFNVWPDQATCEAGLKPGDSLQPFTLELTLLDEGRLRVKMIHHNEQEWAWKKGIGPAILAKAREIVGKRIVSSVKYNPLTEERREDDADEMWQKMVTRGDAIYLELEYRFEVLRAPQ